MMLKIEVDIGAGNPNIFTLSQNLSVKDLTLTSNRLTTPWRPGFARNVLNRPSTSAMVCLSMPAAPRLARTSSHARSRTSLRWTLS